MALLPVVCVRAYAVGFLPTVGGLWGWGVIVREWLGGGGGVLHF
jgi:hypothetical protein